MASTGPVDRSDWHGRGYRGIYRAGTRVEPGGDYRVGNYRARTDNGFSDHYCAIEHHYYHYNQCDLNTWNATGSLLGFPEADARKWQRHTCFTSMGPNRVGVFGRKGRQHRFKKIARKPHIVWSLGPKASKYQSLEP